MDLGTPAYTLSIIEDLPARALRWSCCWALTLTGDWVEVLCWGAPRSCCWAFALTGSWIEVLVSRALQDCRTYTAAVLFIENLSLWTLCRSLGTLTLAGDWIELLCSCTAWSRGTLTLTSIAIEPLITWALGCGGTLTLAGVSVEDLWRSASGLPIRTLTLARCRAKDLWSVTRHGMGTLALAGVSVKDLGRAAIALCVTHTPTVSEAENLSWWAWLWPDTYTPAQVVVESEWWLTRLGIPARASAGILVEYEWRSTGFCGQRTLAPAGPGVEDISRWAPLSNALTLAAVSAEILTTWAAPKPTELDVAFTNLVQVCM